MNSADATQKIQGLLQNLRDESQPNATDRALGHLNWRDFPALRQAQSSLTVTSKEKTLDVLFRSRLTAMVGTLNLYLDPELSFSWRKASLLAARASGKGDRQARTVRSWIHWFLASGELPVHQYGQRTSSVLEDEDVSQAIQLHMQSIAKEGYIRAQDVVDYVATPMMQQRLGGKKTEISVCTAQRWLRKLDWQFSRKRNGMYIDGHERDDVVAYRTGFLARWDEYTKRMVTYDHLGNVLTTPDGFCVPGGRFRLILVTHDESTFYANDRRKTKWIHSTEKVLPERKGEGQSLMVSDFLTSEWGRLKDDNE